MKLRNLWADFTFAHRAPRKPTPDELREAHLREVMLDGIARHAGSAGREEWSTRTTRAIARAVLDSSLRKNPAARKAAKEVLGCDS